MHGTPAPAPIPPGRPRRRLVTAAALAALLLAGAAAALLLARRGAGPGDAPGTEDAALVRAALAAGRASEARALLVRWEGDPARGPVPEGLRAEVVRAEGAALKHEAVALYRAGRPSEVVRLLEQAPVGLASKESLEVLRRARCWLAAEERLAAGRPAEALAQVDEAGEEGGLVAEGLRDLRRRAEAALAAAAPAPGGAAPDRPAPGR